MKYILTLVVLITSFLIYTSYINEKHLFILAGQSNMSRLDPHLSFIPSIEDIFGKGHVIVVKDSEGGQPIRRWYKKWMSTHGETPKNNGDLYDRLMIKVNQAIQHRNIATVTFIWMQGETDAAKRHGDVYQHSLQGLIDQLSQDLQRHDINVVIGRISDTHMKPSKYSHWLEVRQAQVAFAENRPRTAWVNTDDLNDGINSKGYTLQNGLHYSVDGYKTLGQRFADTSITLIQQQRQDMAPLE